MSNNIQPRQQLSSYVQRGDCWGFVNNPASPELSVLHMINDTVYMVDLSETTGDLTLYSVSKPQLLASGAHKVFTRPEHAQFHGFNAEDHILPNAGEVWYFQDTSPFWDVDEERTVDDIERINAAADGDAFVLPEFISHRSGNIVVHISLEIQNLDPKHFRPSGLVDLDTLSSIHQLRVDYTPVWDFLEHNVRPSRKVDIEKDPLRRKMTRLQRRSTLDKVLKKRFYLGEAQPHPAFH